MTEILVRYAHFISIIVFSSMLVAEHILLKRSMTSKELKLLGRFDAVYGISAVCVFVAGLALWLWTGKPSEFYTQNPVFLTKVAVFVFMGVCSIYPTVFFLKNRANTDGDIEIEVPASVINVVRVELLALVLLPLLAVFMARGVGL